MNSVKKNVSSEHIRYISNQFSDGVPNSIFSHMTFNLF